MDWDNVKEPSPEKSTTTGKVFWRALNTTATKCFSTVLHLFYFSLSVMVTEFSGYFILDPSEG